MNKKRILFCTSIFSEDVNSSGRHMIDLVREFDALGYNCEVASNISTKSDEFANTRILESGFKLRDRSKLLRLLVEILNPFFLYLKYANNFRHKWYDGCIVYSPSIFWYFLVKLLSKKINGKKILILRDLFPLWLGQIGMLNSNSFIYRILDYFCLKQLQTFDTILVQHADDAVILRDLYNFDAEIHVLENWYSQSPVNMVSDRIKHFCQESEYTLCVVGNFGAAQNIDHAILVLETILKANFDLKILFVGQSDEASALFNRALTNFSERTHFIPSVKHDEMINILRMTNAGFFGLDFRNTQGHFPGKVLAYLMASRPVFGYASACAAIKELLEREDLGLVTSAVHGEEIARDFEKFRSVNWSSGKIDQYANENFSATRARQQLEEYM